VTFGPSATASGSSRLSAVTFDPEALDASQLHDRLVEMSRADCLRHLRDTRVGRLALSIGALPAIFPVRYAVLDDDIVFRTGSGTKLGALSGAVVAFEIDQADPLVLDGWSVVVVGVARTITDAPTLARAAELQLALWARGQPDTFVRLETSLVSGRQLRAPGRDEPPR
jgi:nitroimidazol reductase NimA-like FMN-containing flavoprotein (pyridoxamine 5'-phosphate oxidase superfamily)